MAVCDIMEKWVHVTDFMAEVGPMDPIAQADLLGLSHDPVGTRAPRSSGKTGEVSLVSGRSISRELSCGRGKSALNLVRNWWSVSL